MTKDELIQKVQENGNFESKKAAKEALDAVVKSIQDAVVAREEVALVGFGTFKIKHVPEKSGEVNGVKYNSPAHDVPVFKAGAGFKRAVEGNE